MNAAFIIWTLRNENKSYCNSILGICILHLRTIIKKENFKSDHDSAWNHGTVHLRNCAPFGTNYLWRGECRILISILVCWWRIRQGLREPAGTEGTVCNGPNHLSDYKICFICLNATQPEDVLTARQCPGTAPGNPLPPGSRANCPWTRRWSIPPKHIHVSFFLSSQNL